MRQAIPLHIGRLLSTFVLIIVCLSLFSCSANDTIPTEKCKGTAEQYGNLASAIRSLANVKIALYGQGDLPQELTAEEFIESAKKEEQLPPEYYDELKQYKLVMNVTGNEYILKAYNPENGCLILYDCSCSETFLDGAVFLDPAKYNEDNLSCDCNR